MAGRRLAGLTTSSPPRPPRSATAKLRQDLDVWARARGRPADFGLILRLVLLEPGFQLAVALRAQESLGRLPIAGRLLRRLLWYATTIWTSCHIAPSARFGGGLYMPHPSGIVIGAGSIIGSHATLYQQVTLGQRDPDIDGMPSLGDHCFLSAGAKILGPVRLGDHVTVGANAVVLIDIPAGHTAVGIPARVLPRDTTKYARCLTPLPPREPPP